MATDIESGDVQDIDSYMEDTEYLNLWDGKNGTTTFLPKKGKKVEKWDLVKKVTYMPNKEKMCLTRDQATQIYEEVEKNELINIQVISQCIESEKKVRKGPVKEEDIDMIENPYQKAITNVNIKDENKIEQMINWSIFSDKIRYVDTSINVTPKLTIRPLEENKHLLFFFFQIITNEIL